MKCHLKNLRHFTNRQFTDSTESKPSIVSAVVLLWATRANHNHYL